MYAKCLLPTSVHAAASLRKQVQVHRALRGTGLGAQQELTQQLRCLWFPKRVHLWSKWKVLSVHVFLKNKIHLQKRSFSSIPLSAVRSPCQAIQVAPCLVPLRVFPVAFLSSREQLVGSLHAAIAYMCHSQCSDMHASEGLMASVRLGGQLPWHLKFSFQSYHPHLAQWPFCNPFCFQWA